MKNFSFPFLASFSREKERESKNRIRISRSYRDFSLADLRRPYWPNPTPGPTPVQDQVQSPIHGNRPEANQNPIQNMAQMQ